MEIPETCTNVFYIGKPEFHCLTFSQSLLDIAKVENMTGIQFVAWVY